MWEGRRRKEERIEGEEKGKAEEGARGCMIAAME